jgi:serine/threonine protein kinase
MSLLQGQLEYGQVAVKQLSQNCIDEKEFTREVECLMKAKHKNIVRCLGYCSDTQGQMVKYNGQFVMADVRQRLLCFEYVPKGTLDEYIKGTIIYMACNFNLLSSLLPLLLKINYFVRAPFCI